MTTTDGTTISENFYRPNSENTIRVFRLCRRKMEVGKLGTNAMKRVAAGAHLPIPWLFEPAKRPEDRTDYCLDTRQ